MAKKPSSRKQPVRSRKGTKSKPAAVTSSRPDKPASATQSAAKPTAQASEDQHTGTKAKKPQATALSGTKPEVQAPGNTTVKTVVSEPVGSPVAQTAKTPQKAKPPAEALPDSLPDKASAAKPVALATPRMGQRSVTQAEPAANTPKTDTPPPASPAMAPMIKPTPDAPPKTTAVERPAVEAKSETAPAPAVKPAPATPDKGPDEASLPPMPAQAESVHVEEPLPDEAPFETTPAPYRPELFIVHISPEMAPVAKVGGLADVVFGLTGELSIRGNHVEIILPKYDNLRYDHIYEVHEVYKDLWVPWYDGAIHCTVYFGFVHGRKCYFIEPHSQDNFFNRGSVYGFPDDILRFAFFSRAAMEFLWKAGKHPDIIHCHDWQTALVPVLLYEIYQQMGMTHPRACLTIHNFKHQGVAGLELLRATGLHDPERYFDYNRMRDNHNQHALNLLKGGIVYSNFVTTVSPHYAMETRDQNQGFGLEATLHTHQMKYGGVLNGIDYNVWNPEVDHLIPARYGVDNIEAKYDNKRALRHRLMLADNEKPIVAFIGRLDPQKGLELVRHAIFQSLERGAQVVLLGSSPDQRINADFWHLKHMLNDSPDCHLEIGYDEELSHLIYAGSDIMLVPSQFEPCGLTQLISLRYGTIPVVRSVGGLADTVFDKDHSYRPLHERNGYVFENYDNPGLESALGRAISCYFEYPEHFRELIRNAMRTDYSWNRPGQDYMNIYDYIRDK